MHVEHSIWDTLNWYSQDIGEFPLALESGITSYCLCGERCIFLYLEVKSYLPNTGISQLES